MVQTKYWCFTLNNYTDAETTKLETLVERVGRVVFVCWGYERGEQGTPHLQGYLELGQRARLNTVKRILELPRIHLEKRRGTRQQAIDYCRKDGDFHSFGDLPELQRGRRTDLEHVKRIIDSGGREAMVAEEEFAAFIRYHRGIRRYISIRIPRRTSPPTVTVYWGQTGTGKTRKVWEDHAQADVWVYPGGGWFDGYHGQQVALFDDYSGSELKLSYLLKVLDRYPLKVPIKGDFMEWNPEFIYLTSNINPDVWYPNAHEEHRLALRRRFTRVIHFTNLQ